MELNYYPQPVVVMHREASKTEGQTHFLYLILLVGREKKNQMLLYEFIIILFKGKTHKNPICCSLDLMYPCLIPSFTECKIASWMVEQLSVCPARPITTGFNAGNPIYEVSLLSYKTHSDNVCSSDYSQAD